MVDAAEQIVQGEQTRGAATFHVSSRRFGSFDVPADRVLTFPQGLIGFPDVSRFVILDHRPGSPFKWMLSLDDPELGFAVANPGELVAGYEPPLDLAARVLGVETEDVALFVIVTIPSDPAAMTVNLMAPVVADLRTRRARQLVLDGSRFETRHRVLASAESGGAET